MQLSAVITASAQHIMSSALGKRWLPGRCLWSTSIPPQSEALQYIHNFLPRQQDISPTKSQSLCIIRVFTKFPVGLPTLNHSSIDTIIMHDNTNHLHVSVIHRNQQWYFAAQCETCCYLICFENPLYFITNPTMEYVINLRLVRKVP